MTARRADAALSPRTDAGGGVDESLVGERQVAYHRRLERIVRVLRFVAAGLALGFGDLLPNIGYPFVIVLGVFLAGYGVIVSVLWFRARTSEAIERASQMTLAADVAVVGFALLVFARDPGWTIYAAGFLIIATGALRFRNGAVLAAASLSLTYVVVSAFRFVELGIPVSVGQYAFQLGTYLIAGMVLNVVVPEIEALRRREADLYTPLLRAQEESGEAVAIFDDGRLVFWNRALQTLTGHPSTRLRSIRAIQDLLIADPKVLSDVAEAQRPFLAVLQRSDGQRLAVDVTLRRTVDRDRERRILILREAARPGGNPGDDAPMHDTLTGLPNASLLRERAMQTLPWAERKSRPVSVVLIDLDGFNRVNEKLGRRAGDLVLIEIATRLSRSVRETDMVGRLAEDRFVALLVDMGSAAAEEAARGLVRSIGAPIGLDGEVISVGASVGIAVFPTDGRDIETLLANARRALSAAKRAGTGWRAFEPHHDPSGERTR